MTAATFTPHFSCIRFSPARFPARHDTTQLDSPQMGYMKLPSTYSHSSSSDSSGSPQTPPRSISPPPFVPPHSFSTLTFVDLVLEPTFTSMRILRAVFSQRKRNFRCRCTSTQPPHTGGGGGTQPRGNPHPTATGSSMSGINETGLNQSRHVLVPIHQCRSGAWRTWST